jgi:GNAT superfamily N-acetyltransferase
MHPYLRQLCDTSCASLQIHDPGRWAGEIDDLSRGYTLVIVTDKATDALVAVVETTESPDTTTCVLDLLEVMAAYRGHGVGRMVMDELLRLHVQERHQRFTIHCPDASLPFYHAVAQSSNGVVTQDGTQGEITMTSCSSPSAL